MARVICLEHDYPLVSLTRTIPGPSNPDSCVVDTLARATRGWRTRKNCGVTAGEVPSIVGIADLGPMVQSATAVSPNGPVQVRGTSLSPVLRGATTAAEGAPGAPSGGGEKLVPTIRKAKRS